MAIDNTDIYIDTDSDSGVDDTSSVDSVSDDINDSTNELQEHISKINDEDQELRTETEINETIAALGSGEEGSIEEHSNNQTKENAPECKFSEHPLEDINDADDNDEGSIEEHSNNQTQENSPECKLVAASEHPLEDIDEFYSREDDGDDEEDINDGSIEKVVGPQTNEEVDELMKKKRREKKKKKKAKKEKEMKIQLEVAQAEKKKNEPLSHEQVGMIRYSAMARVHIGEVHNPRIGELPSRTASLPVKEPRPTEIADLPIVGPATTLASKIFVADGSSSEYETEEVEEEDEEDESNKEDDSFVGAIKEGVGILKTIVAPEKKDDYEELKTAEGDEGDKAEGDEEAPKVQKKKKMVKRKKKKVKPIEVELDPRRPLEPMEIEEGKRLQETTPLSLRMRHYASIFEREVDNCGLKRFCSCNIVILGVRLTEGQICLGGIFVIFFVAYVISTAQSSGPNESIQQVDVGVDMDKPEAEHFQPTYGTSRGSLIP